MAECALLPIDLERRVWRTYFRDHVVPDLLSRFQARWIEVRVGSLEWSCRRTATTVKFDRSRVVRLTEPLVIPFPCMEGEAEFAAIVFGLAGERREGYSRRWTAHRAGQPYWKCWIDYMAGLPCRTLLVHKRLTKFVVEAEYFHTKKRKLECL